MTTAPFFVRRNTIKSIGGIFMIGNYRSLACSAGAIAIALLSVSPAYAQVKPVSDQPQDARCVPDQPCPPETEDR
ncbi:MAG: hypothetical protein ACTMKV_12600, partial [Sphingomonas parapaucimobilis]